MYNVYKFMLKMQGGNPAAFNHLQLEYATIPAADAKRDYLPMLIRSQESAVDQTGCVYELWISASQRVQTIGRSSADSMEWPICNEAALNWVFKGTNSS